MQCTPPDIVAHCGEQCKQPQPLPAPDRRVVMMCRRVAAAASPRGAVAEAHLQPCCCPDAGSRSCSSSTACLLRRVYNSVANSSRDAVWCAATAVPTCSTDMCSNGDHNCVNVSRTPPRLPARRLPTVWWLPAAASAVCTPPAHRSAPCRWGISVCANSPPLCAAREEGHLSLPLLQSIS